MIAFILYGVLSVIFSMRKVLRQKELLLLQEQELADNRVTMLTNQIRPHFIFNSLASIQTMCKKNPDKAAEAVSHFSKYLRSSIEAMTMQTAVLFQKELESIREYVSLEQLEREYPIEMNYDLGIKEFYLPFLTVQPIVENAIRHGIKDRPNGRVDLITFTEKNRLCVVVRDNGVGFKREMRDEGTGLKNVRERIQYAGGTLEVESELGKGTTATITLPLRENLAGWYMKTNIYGG